VLKAKRDNAIDSVAVESSHVPRSPGGGWLQANRR